MVGYVKIFKPELKVKEYEAYRGIYCTLCKTLGKEYGVLSRMLLSYDLTFLSVILLSAEKSAPSFCAGRCPFNITKKCNYCNSSFGVFSYTAAVTVLMFYYKIKDEISDGSFIKKSLAYLFYPYARYLRNKARKKYGQLDDHISSSMEKQALCEKENTSDIDLAAHNSADALGRIFTYFKNNDVLYRFGYLIGRWVYLTDAADDLQDDIKYNTFNVFKNKYEIKKTEDITDEIWKEIEGSLNMCQAVIAETYMKLDFVFMSPIVENVIFDSFTNTISAVTKGNSQNERSI